MKNIFLHILLCIFVITSFHCGITQPVRTIPKEETRLTASFGGPIIPLGDIAIPVPYLNAGGQYGASDDLTLFGNFHITSLLFKDIGVDGGAASRLLKENGIYPEVTVQGRLLFFWDFIRSGSTRLFPSATVNASYAVGRASLFYFGADNLYQVHEPEYFFAPFIGYRFPLSKTMTMQMESKWLAANKETRHGIFEGVTSVSGKGNISFYLGMEMVLQ
ncbi:MAG: hypothetical protein WCT99_07900 [Bacteroidota bacterium]